MSDSLTLYGDAFWISPYVYSCHVALKEKGLPFTYVPVALHTGEQKKAEFAARGLTSRVPSLTHGDFALGESTAIVEYLDEVFPAPAHAAMLPASPRDRARARQLMGWVRSDLMAIREERSTHTMFYDRAKSPLSPAGAEAAAKLIRVAESVLPTGRATLFDAFSIADADLALMLQRLIMNGDDVPSRLRDYAATHWARPSIRSFVEQKRPPYVDY